MRHLFCCLALVVLLALAVPAQAQLRSQVPQQVPVKVMDEGSAFTLNKLFNPEFFQMRHSYSIGHSSFGGMGLTMGEYTNTMLWQFSQKLGARVDVAFAHTPFGTGSAQALFNGKETYGKLYVQNAEIAYRPRENMTLHLSFHQSPYGSYMSPYGYGSYGGYGYNRAYRNPYRGYGSRGYGYEADFFWR